MSAASLSIAFVRRAGEIDAALWDACFPPPLEGRWWYEALEQSGLEDQFTFAYGLILRGGVPVGIAPTFLMDFPVALVAPGALQALLRWLGRRVAWLTHPRTLFVGSPCADQGTVGLLPGVDRRAALRALQDALAARAREAGAALLVWKDMADAEAADMEWLAREARLFHVASYPATLVEFIAGDKAGYWAGLKGTRRHVLQKKLRRSHARVELETEAIHAPDSATLDELYALFRQTYERATTRFEDLDRRFFEAIARQPVAHFIALREKTGGERVAFMLCFDLGQRVINKFIGFDYGRPREWLLYFRLWDAAVDWALARGAKSIQSGQTGYAPKIETGHRLLPLHNYCAHRNPLVHALAGIVGSRIGWSTLDDDLARHLRAHPAAAPRESRSR